MPDNGSLTIHSKIPIEKLLKSRAYIGGCWIDTPAKFTVRDPRTRSSLGRVADLGEHGEAQAFKAAQGEWQKLLPEQRQDTLGAWVAGIEVCQNALALILSSEQGCLWQAAKSEIAATLSGIEHQLNCIKLNSSAEVPVLRIDSCPQSPVSDTINRAIPAMLGGQAVVVRPPHQAPLTLLALAAIAEHVNLPPGAFNVVP